ncbi:hypothetical protein D3C72_2270810 [compost metagenome]
MWNLQPEGGLAGLGISPFSTIRSRFSLGMGTGTADRRALVYGCWGRRNSSSREAVSTMEPRYITPMREQRCSTTLRSWEMNR